MACIIIDIIVKTLPLLTNILKHSNELRLSMQDGDYRLIILINK